MDQLILQWLSNKEANRHNMATEAEAHRHNRNTEFLQHQQIQSNERIAAANRAANIAMNRYSADKHLEGTKYSSQQSRAATEYSASKSAWASQYHTMVDAGVRRQANLIQDRYNKGRLAVAMSEMEEAKRANRAREEENRMARMQSNELRTKELELNQDKLAYERSRDIADRSQRQLQHDQKMRAEYTKQAIDLLEVGSKWYTAVKGVKRVNVQENKSNKTIIEKALEELTGKGR